MRQTKKWHKTMRNFRTTKRKRGGMPTGTPKGKELDRVLPLVKSMQAKLEKKRRGESPRQALYDIDASMAAYEKHLKDQEQMKLNKKNAEIAAKVAASEAALAAAEEKSQKAATAKALKEEKELKATNAKVAADEKRAAEAEKTRLAAENAEKRRLEKEKAEVERKKLVAEKTAAKVTSVLPPPPSTNKVNLPTWKIESLDKTPSEPYYDEEFWLQFFPDETIRSMQALVPTIGCVDELFYIPEEGELADILRKLIVIYGTIASRFNRVEFTYQLAWKGTRALGLNDPVKMKQTVTRDIDIGIISTASGEAESDINRRKNLAFHIAGLTNHILKDITLSILTPDKNKHNDEIVKLSYIDAGKMIALVDIGFIQTPSIQIIEDYHILHPDANSNGYKSLTLKCFGNLSQLYIHPTTADMKNEKELYIRKYIDDPERKYDKKTIERFIENMSEGLVKIKFVLGELSRDKEEEFLNKQKEKEEEFIRKQKGKEDQKKEAELIVKIAMTDKENRNKDAEKVRSGILTKEELQELLDARSKSTMPSQSRTSSSNNTSSKPSYPLVHHVDFPAHTQTTRNATQITSGTSSSGHPSSRL